MFKSVFFRIVMALVLIGALVGIGAYAYQAGMAQGALAVQSAQPSAGTAPVPAYPLYMMPFGRPGMGFWFGPLSCLIPLFFIFLAFAAFRGLFWRGPRMMGPMHMHRRGWDTGEPGKDIPPFVEEWHRRMHEQPTSGEPTGKPTA